MPSSPGLGTAEVWNGSPGADGACTIARVGVLGPPPFVLRGPIPLNLPCYVTRECEQRVKSALLRHDFIWIDAQPGFGKTCLFARHGEWLAHGWCGISTDIGWCDQTSSDPVFKSALFALMERSIKLWHPIRFEKGKEWIALVELAEKHKLVFLIDEIGRCKNGVFKELVEKLYKLTTSAPGRVKVVAFFAGTPVPIIKSAGLSAEKYAKCWQVVRLDRFSDDDVCKLVGLFPEPASSLLLERVKRLCQITRSEPQKTQNALHHVWTRMEDLKDYRSVSGEFIDTCLLAIGEDEQ